MNADFGQSAHTSAAAPEHSDVLDSWKQIAAYLNREVRTVQRWEKREGLPVHRHVHARGATVYASKKEIDGWRTARDKPQTGTLVNLKASNLTIAFTPPPPHVTMQMFDAFCLWLSWVKRESSQECNDPLPEDSSLDSDSFYLPLRRHGSRSQ
jgi:hypothetical protein